MQKNKKSGLPETLAMRHDDHFVDLIAAKSTGPSIRLLSVDRIDPNPQQARNEIGNIQELMASIKEKGILEPILVRPKDERYEIIAGERRYIASQRLGVDKVPCIVMNVKDNEAMEISLIENLQRKDLDVFEEANGLKALADMYGYNHQTISEKIGKARSTVTEILALSKIPLEVRDFCKKAKITSRSTLLEIAKQKTKEHMLGLLNEIQSRDLRREDTRQLAKQISGKKPVRLKRYVYNYRPEGTDDYRLRMEFRKEKISKTEIIEILEEIIEKLRN